MPGAAENCLAIFSSAIFSIGHVSHRLFFPANFSDTGFAKFFFWGSTYLSKYFIDVNNSSYEI